MLGGGEQRHMGVDSEPLTPLPINSRALVVVDPSALKHVGESAPFSREDMQNGMHGQPAESVVNHSKKLQDDLQELGEKIKHHEVNVKYLKTLKNKLEDSILEMQVSIGKYHTASFSKVENEDPSSVESEEEIIQHILKCKKSVAALLCRMRSNPEAQVSDHPLMKDVLGIVATLGKVDDVNLSRLFSEYLGLETMLAVVCKTFEGVKALEGYTKDGLINKGFGIDAFAASTGRPQDDRFLVICLENLIPYAGELIADDPQRRLDLLKPRLINGETPQGFLGFAVNMITIDNTNLYGISKTGHSLRETLFYYLFSNLQVYRSREDMLKALPCIPNGAISLDGGMIRSPGVFALGHHRENIDVKFPCDCQRFNLPVNYFETENQLKETKRKKDRAWEDLQREQALLDHVRYSYETKKREFVQFLAETSSYSTQYQVGRVSTPR
ncbi:protein DEFECTIVE IN MERISTEM SILENCING 3 [Sesamum indicum]|uniref:Protein DEFECTIVE IN MERISTEM SILENCING 3 n=1 Tax=Sesamum indicum TaxID=4182 RepID=A0A6I9T8U5_SESIN|nr:protein DEFECTIVE IN MERISTEM SILENCING 3 [Sesamum indicum]